MKIENYIIPGAKSVAHLEYEWEPYRRVLAFQTDHAFSEASNWYRKEIDGSENETEDAGQFEFYFEASAIDGLCSVLLADVTTSSAIENLDSYAGSSVLKEIIDTAARGCVGLIFQRKPQQEIDEKYDREEEGKRISEERNRAFSEEILPSAKELLAAGSMESYARTLTPYRDLLSGFELKRLNTIEKKLSNQAGDGNSE